MKRWMIIVAMVAATVGGITALAAMPTKCPFVNADTGLDCIGIPIPDGISVAGSKWKCSLNGGHRWITKD
jgi:hypothetical protein